MTQHVSQEIRSTPPGRARRTPRVADAGAPARPAEDREAASLQQLLDVFEAHIAAEADTLVAYRCLCATTGDRLTTLLLQLVLDDEERHHGLLERMAARLTDSLHWTHSTTALPRPADLADEATPATLEAFRRAIRDEQNGARALRAMARRDRDLYSGLFSLLLETMATDSEKHARILRFILQRLEAAA